MKLIGSERVPSKQQSTNRQEDHLLDVGLGATMTSALTEAAPGLEYHAHSSLETIERSWKAALCVHPWIDWGVALTTGWLWPTSHALWEVDYTC